MTNAHDLARTLAAFAEALIEGRRVLVVGDSSLALHELLTELGARAVHVYDPDAQRALAQPPPTARGTVLRGLPEGDFDVRDGAFDLALVPDIASMSDPAALLARLRRVVGPEGAVLASAPNHEDGGGLDYYALFDLVSLQFAHVRMIAAMPFVGVTLAELGQDEVEAAVRVDTQLAGERPQPEAFLALASQADVALDAYTVLELEARAEAKLAPRSDDGAALAQAHLRAQYLEGQVQELADARAARARADEEARRALEALEVERERARRLERDLGALAASAAQAKQAPARDRSEELAERLAQEQIRAAALEEGLELVEKTVASQRNRIADLEAVLVDLEEAIAAQAADQAIPAQAADQAIAAQAADQAIPAQPPSPTVPPSEPVDPGDDVVALETKLRERAAKLAELEAEVARRDKMVRELVARLDVAAPGFGFGVDLEKKLDELALLAARQKSELEARAWRIAELERSVPLDADADADAGRA